MPEEKCDNCEVNPPEGTNAWCEPCMDATDWIEGQCFICKEEVSKAVWIGTQAEFKDSKFARIVCYDCACDIDSGALEYESRIEIQAMIEKALHFIADFGAEAWNTVVEEVVKQAK